MTYFEYVFNKAFVKVHYIEFPNRTRGFPIGIRGSPSRIRGFTGILERADTAIMQLELDQQTLSKLSESKAFHMAPYGNSASDQFRTNVDFCFLQFICQLWYIGLDSERLWHYKHICEL